MSLPAPRDSDDRDDRSDLRAALLERDQFIGVLGHELRNAMAPLMLLAEHYASDVDVDPTGKVARRQALLVKHLHKLGATLDRVTEVTQLRQGKLELQLRATDLADLAGQACRRFEADARASGASLHCHLAPEAIGHWDPDRVRQIVNNLVSNAVRHAGGGRVDITVSADAEIAELTVRDHGPGIPAAKRATMFDRGSNARATAGGLGVGLWVVRTLCEAMRGTVAYEAAPGGGALFRVRLPRG